MNDRRKKIKCSDKAKLVTLSFKRARTYAADTPHV